MEVEISGSENLTHSDVDLIRQLAEKTARKNNVLTKMNLDVDTHSKTGERHLYVISVRAQTDKGFFNAEASEWQLNVAVKEALRKLDKCIFSEMKRKRGK